MALTGRRISTQDKEALPAVSAVNSSLDLCETALGSPSLEASVERLKTTCPVGLEGELSLAAGLYPVTSQTPSDFENLYSGATKQVLDSSYANVPLSGLGSTKNKLGVSLTFKLLTNEWAKDSLKSKYNIFIIIIHNT